MNVEVLRARYKELTPFERASLLTLESVGLRRESEADALQAPTLYDALWTSQWDSNFFIIAAVAMFQACWQEKVALLERFEGKNEDAMLEAAYKACGWLVALKRLEDETGAPLVAAGKILNPKYAEGMLAFAQKLKADGEEPYQVLRDLWSTVTENVNQEDARRFEHA